VTRPLPDAEATRALGMALGNALLAARPAHFTVHLGGGLGAGKTELARGVLAALGHTGRVPSPTYTLVEPYAAGGYNVLHVDLYRLRDPAELDDLGLIDALGPGTLALIEWPGQGGGRLPPADLAIDLEVDGSGRLATLRGLSEEGQALLAAMAGTPA
jgi:tRNA threonylcarbamoyladenosine biosynthesis protein TsaE